MTSATATMGQDPALEMMSTTPTWHQQWEAQSQMFRDFAATGKLPHGYARVRRLGKELRFRVGLDENAGRDSTPAKELLDEYYGKLFGLYVKYALVATITAAAIMGGVLYAFGPKTSDTRSITSLAPIAADQQRKYA